MSVTIRGKVLERVESQWGCGLPDLPFRTGQAARRRSSRDVRAHPIRDHSGNILDTALAVKRGRASAGHYSRTGLACEESTATGPGSTRSTECPSSLSPRAHLPRLSLARYPGTHMYHLFKLRDTAAHLT